MHCFLPVRNWLAASAHSQLISVITKFTKYHQPALSCQFLFFSQCEIVCSASYNCGKLGYAFCLFLFYIKIENACVKAKSIFRKIDKLS